MLSVLSDAALVRLLYYIAVHAPLPRPPEIVRIRDAIWNEWARRHAAAQLH